jgi:hypothetical protein
MGKRHAENAETATVMIIILQPDDSPDMTGK